MSRFRSTRDFNGWMTRNSWAQNVECPDSQVGIFTEDDPEFDNMPLHLQFRSSGRYATDGHGLDALDAALASDTPPPKDKPDKSVVFAVKSGDDTTNVTTNQDTTNVITNQDTTNRNQGTPSKTETMTPLKRRRLEPPPILDK